MIDIPSLLFYLFATLTALSGLLVITARNPVFSVFYLIFAFFNAAGLLVLLGAEYVAMTLVIVYVGAVAVLFLFVVMMLNINLAEMKQGFLRYLPVGAAIGGILLTELVLVFKASSQLPGYQAAMNEAQAIPENLSNTQAIGSVLYTHYVVPFQISGLVLLVAMIGAIVLTLRSRPGVRRQNIMQQLSRKKSDAMELLEVVSGKGV